MRLVGGKPRDLTGTLEACKLGAPLSGYEARAIGQELDGARKRITELEQQVKARGAVNAILERDLQVVEKKLEQACWAGLSAQVEGVLWKRRYWCLHGEASEMVKAMAEDLDMARAELKAMEARYIQDGWEMAERIGELEQERDLYDGLLDEIAEAVNGELRLEQPLGAMAAVRYVLRALRVSCARMHQVQAALELERSERDLAENALSVLGLLDAVMTRYGVEGISK